MNKPITIKLIDVVDGDARPFGNEDGREAFQKLATKINDHPSQSIFEISLEGIKATDASFPRESVVSLAKMHRSEKGFYLTHFGNKDLIDNWMYGAEAKDQPLTIILDDGSHQWIGPEIKEATFSLLEFIYDQGVVTTSKVAEHFDISTQNASGKLKKLYNQGFILGSRQSAESGGHEFVYKAIK